MSSRDKALAVFDQLDVDGSGSLSRREIVEGLEAAGFSRCDALGVCVDILEGDDGDQKITKEEFLAALKE